MYTCIHVYIRICVTWFVHECDMTYAWVRSVSLHEGVGAFHVRPINTCAWRDCVSVYIYVHIYMYTYIHVYIHTCIHTYVCDMTVCVYIYVCMCTYVCIHISIHTCMCDVTRSWVWHDSFISATWLVRECDMTRSWVWHDSFICVTWLIACGLLRGFMGGLLVCVCVTWLVHKCDVAHS